MIATTTSLPTSRLTLWDAILHYDTKSWRVAINGNNLSDKTYVANARPPPTASMAKSALWSAA
jgi:iron complex outermembrane receptor protein